MPYKYERLYGVPATCNFVLWEADGVSINATASAVLGDVVLSQDFGVSSNTTNLFSAHSSGMGHQLVLTSAEMSTSKIMVRLVDQDSTKEWLDDILFIETYGNENSVHNRRNSGIILETTIASVSGDAEFTVTDKPTNNNTLLNSVAMIFDNTGEESPPDTSFRNVSSYTGATGRVELASDADFSPAVGDRVVFMPTADVQTADEIASAVWDVLRTNHTTDGTYGQGVLVESLNASAQQQVSAVADDALVNYEVVTINNLPTNFISLAIDASGKTTVGVNEDKDGYQLALSAYVCAAEVALTHDWSAISTSAAPRSTWNSLRFLRNRWAVSADALTVYKENDTSAAWTAALTITTSADAISESNPD
jgi:hypothetical protein